MRSLYRDVAGMVKRFWFSFPLVLTLLLSYGTRIVTDVISIDDLMRSRYLATAYFGVNRFGGPLFFRLLAISERYPVAEKLLSTLLLGIAAVLFCVVLMRASGNALKAGVYTAFACLLVSYPLICEIWNYSGTESVISLAMSFAACSLLTLMEWRNNRRFLPLVQAMALMVLAMSFFESLAGVFITGVFMILILRYRFGTEEDRKWKPIVCDGMVFAGVLAVAVVVRLAVSYLIRALLGIARHTGANNSILYGTGGVSVLSQLKSLLFNDFRYYVLEGLLYFPIAVFSISMILAVVLMFLLWKRGGKSVIVLLFAGLIGSCFLLSLLQGALTPYRAAQPVMLFCAFILAFTLALLLDCPRRWIRYAASVAACLLVLNQAMYLNKMFSLNYLRSEEEKHAVMQISERLHSTYPFEKPVVFVGTYQLSDTVMQGCSADDSDAGYRIYCTILERLGIRELPERYCFTQNSISSYLEYTVYCAPEPVKETLNYFSYYGYSLTPGTDAQWREAHELSADMGCWPARDSIRDAGDYVIVKLGPLAEIGDAA